VSITRATKKKVLGLGVLFVVLALLPTVVKSPYYMHLVIMTCDNIILGLSFSLLYSTGLLTMAAGAFWGIGAYTSALLVMKAGLSFWIALPLSGVCAALIGLGTGSIIARIPGIAFLIQTMIISLIIPEVVGYSDFLGSWGGLLGIPGPSSIGPLRFIGKTPYYYLIVVLLMLNVLAFVALYSSRVGRAWRSIRVNAQLAETLGINLHWYRLLAFIISSASAGLAGSFYAHYFQALEPGMFTAFKSINVQIFAILGGLNYYIVGPAVGAAIMTFVPELLRVGREIEPVITGAVLILLVIFLPGGVLSLRERLGSFSWRLANRAGSDEVPAEPGLHKGD
jgi:branched-chain amino acid transport system permease protein